VRPQVGVATQRIEHIMGTAIVIDVRDPAPARFLIDKAIDAAFDHFRAVDERFSTYKAGSEVSRWNRGVLSPADASNQMREVLELCDEARQLSDGYFDIRGHRDDGCIDPSGLVKGWSVDDAAQLLDAAGIVNYCINAAGDIVARGDADPGPGWRIGIRDPWHERGIAATVAVRDQAIATSGAYERGNHVIDPHSHRAPDGVVSMTVVGPSLTWADAWATAAYAMGVRGVDWVARELDEYDACAITSDGHLVMSVGFESLLIES
jgi:thiamine biosynthesis lipoprotein